MKKNLFILLVVLLCTPLFGEDFSSCFIPGEQIDYKVTWMGVPIAWSRLSVDTVEQEGRSLIRIRMLSKSYKAYALFYRVEDLHEVLVDPKTALPVQLDVQIHEGSRKSSHFTRFDFQKKTAFTRNRLTGEEETIPIHSDTRDIYTLIYTLRKVSIADLVNTSRTVFVEGKLYNLELKKHRKKKIKLPEYGKVTSVEIEPLAEFNGFFISKGKTMFWVSTCQRRMVTCIKAKVPIGKVTVKLRRVSGPGNDRWVLPDKK